MNLKRLGLALALTAFSAPFPAIADDYWAYSFKGIDVTAEGSSGYARTTAHNLHRLDLALAAILGIKSAEWRPPTLVYAMPADMYSLVRGVKDTTVSSYHATAVDSTMLINTSFKGDDRYYSIYFGFSGSVLNNAYSVRYPVWFLKGLSMVFGGSTMNHSKVTIGGVAAGRIVALTRNPLIPLRTMLALKPGDPQLASAVLQRVYEEQAWFLVHRIVIEGWHHSNFYEYFRRLDRGEGVEAAFTASFNISYETLDKELADALHAGKLEMLNVFVEDEEDSAEPRRLSDAEAKGRLSVLAAAHSPQAEVAIKLAMQALSADPANEDANIGLAKAQLRQSDYTSALRTAEGFCTSGKLSQKGVSACAVIYSSLRNAVAAKKVSFEMNQASLAARAHVLRKSR